MPSPVRPRHGGGLAFPPETMPLQDNGPPSIPDPGPTDHIYQWEARTSRTTEHRFSGSARGSQVMIPVGKCRVSAPMIGWEDPSPSNPSGSIYFAFCFGVGPAETIGNFVVSGQAEADINTQTMPGLVRPSNNHNHGTDGQSALYYSSTLWGGGADAPRFPNLITTLIGFNKRYMSSIGLPTLQADLSMQSYDFRSGTEAYTENENPILYLYTYMVMNPWGPRVPVSEIDTSSWTTAANWCDTDMDPGAGVQKRWRVGGVLDGGDVSSVISTLLQSCFTTMSWQGGKWVLVPFGARNSVSPTDITADYIRRRRIGLSRRPTVVKVNFRDYNNEYTDSQAIARSAEAIAGTARWVVREDSPPLINYKDVATRYANTLLQSVSNSNRATVKVHHNVCPAVLDLKPGDNVHLSTWREKTGHGGHDYWRVESIHHQELVSELELLGDEDALATTLTTNTTGTKPTIGGSRHVNLGTDGEVAVVDSDGDAHTALTITSDYLVIGDPNDPVELQIYADPATLVKFNDAGISLDNDEYLYGLHGNDTPLQLIGVDDSDKVQVGNDNVATVLHGTSIALPLINGDITLDNNGRLLGEETGGTVRQLAKINASNGAELGDSAVPLNLLGAQVDALPPLANAVALQGKETGGTARTLMILNSSNVLNVGNASNLTVLNGSSISLGAVLDTEGYNIVMDDADIQAKAGWRIAHESSPGSGVYGTLIGTTDLGSTGTLNIGQASGGYYRTVLNSSDYVKSEEEIVLANAKALQCLDSLGNVRSLAVITSGNEAEIGSSSVALNLLGTTIDALPELANNVPLQGSLSEGGVKDLINMNASDQIIVGYTGATVRIMAGSPAIMMTVKNGSGLASIALGDVCYVNGDSSGVPTVLKADADAESTTKGLLVMIAESIAASGTGMAVVYGVLGGLSSLTAAATYYVSTTTGAITTTAPSGTGDIVRIVGHALSTTKFFFNPDQTYVEIV